MKNILAFLVFVAASSSFGQNKYSIQSIHDVVVPTLWGAPTGADLVQGMMYFDATSDSLKFVGSNATPITIGSSTGGVVTTTGPSERIERIQFGGTTNPSACTTSACTIYSQTGVFTSVVRSGLGSYTLNIPAGVFSAPPTCVSASSTISGGHVFISTSQTTTAINVSITNGPNSLNADGNANIICMGPY